MVFRPILILLARIEDEPPKEMEGLGSLSSIILTVAKYAVTYFASFHWFSASGKYTACVLRGDRDQCSCANPSTPVTHLASQN